MTSLLALLAPGVGFASGLFLLRDHPRYLWLNHPAACPWEFALIAVSGLAATAAGVADWRFHRVSGERIGPKERHGELIALALGGLPLFTLMSAASVMRRPQALLLPILATVLFTVACICYDEFVFHRARCGRYETRLHRLLVFGNGVAWLSWMHWCFVRGS
ncbi:MAG: hypothetical protein HY553_04900 [Elusimicrobia bacterium]|nr:hypothetical protein [Elusimicrobiota bacterium]